jgi:hypothetical protein
MTCALFNGIVQELAWPDWQNPREFSQENQHHADIRPDTLRIQSVTATSKCSEQYEQSDWVYCGNTNTERGKGQAQKATMIMIRPIYS